MRSFTRIGLLLFWLAGSGGALAAPPQDDGPPCQGRRLARTSSSGWELVREGGSWAVCRGGQRRYQGALGRLPPERLVEASTGGPVAFLERESSRCELIVVSDEDDEPLKLSLPRCGAGWKPHWTGPDSLHVGPSALEPRLRIRLEQEER